MKSTGRIPCQLSFTRYTITKDDDRVVLALLAGGFIAAVLTAAAKSAHRERKLAGLPDFADGQVIDTCSCRAGESCDVCKEGGAE